MARDKLASSKYSGEKKGAKGKAPENTDPKLPKAPSGTRVLSAKEIRTRYVEMGKSLAARSPISENENTDPKNLLIPECVECGHCALPVWPQQAAIATQATFERWANGTSGKDAKRGGKNKDDSKAGKAALQMFEAMQKKEKAEPSNEKVERAEKSTKLTEFGEPEFDLDTLFKEVEADVAADVDKIQDDDNDDGPKEEEADDDDSDVSEDDDGTGSADTVTELERKVERLENKKDKLEEKNCKLEDKVEQLNADIEEVRESEREIRNKFDFLSESEQRWRNKYQEAKEVTVASESRSNGIAQQCADAEGYLMRMYSKVGALNASIAVSGKRRNQCFESLGEHLGKKHLQTFQLFLWHVWRRWAKAQRVEKDIEEMEAKHQRMVDLKQDEINEKHQQIKALEAEMQEREDRSRAQGAKRLARLFGGDCDPALSDWLKADMPEGRKTIGAIGVGSAGVSSIRRGGDGVDADAARVDEIEKPREGEVDGILEGGGVDGKGQGLEEVQIAGERSSGGEGSQLNWTVIKAFRAWQTVLSTLIAENEYDKIYEQTKDSINIINTLTDTNQQLTVDVRETKAQLAEKVQEVGQLSIEVFEVKDQYHQLERHAAKKEKELTQKCIDDVQRKDEEMRSELCATFDEQLACNEARWQSMKETLEEQIVGLKKAVRRSYGSGGGTPGGSSRGSTAGAPGSRCGSARVVPRGKGLLCMGCMSQLVHRDVMPLASKDAAHVSKEEMSVARKQFFNKEFAGQLDEKDPLLKANWQKKWDPYGVTPKFLPPLQKSATVTGDLQQHGSSKGFGTRKSFASQANLGRRDAKAELPVNMMPPHLRHLEEKSRELEGDSKTVSLPLINDKHKAPPQ